MRKKHCFLHDERDPVLSTCCHVTGCSSQEWVTEERGWMASTKRAKLSTSAEGSFGDCYMRHKSLHALGPFWEVHPQVFFPNILISKSHILSFLRPWPSAKHSETAYTSILIRTSSHFTIQIKWTIRFIMQNSVLETISLLHWASGPFLSRDLML